MKRLLSCLLLASLVIPAGAQNLYKNFEFATVTGRVLTRSGAPVADCQVEIRVLSNQTTLNNTKPQRGSFGDAPPAGWGAGSVDVVASGQYDVTRLKKAGWARTDKDGRYTIQGIPAPGSYVIVVKGMKGFKKAQIPLRVDKPRGDRVEAPDLLLDPFVEMDKKTAKLIEQAEKALSENRLDEAESLLKEANARQSNLSQVHISIGNIYMKKKDFKAAYGEFEAAWNLGERNEQLAGTLMRMAFQMQQFDAAGRYADAVIEKKPDDLMALYLAGVSHYNLKDFSAASARFAAYEKARGDISKDLNYLYVYGMCAFNSGDFGKAADLLSMAYRNGWKADVPFLKTLANAYIKLKKNAEAKAVLKDLLEKFPSFEGREQAEAVYNQL